MRSRSRLAQLQVVVALIVFDECHGNISRAARVLGMHRQSFQRLLKRPGNASLMYWKVAQSPELKRQLTDLARSLFLS